MATGAHNAMKDLNREQQRVPEERRRQREVKRRRQNELHKSGGTALGIAYCNAIRKTNADGQHGCEGLPNWGYSWLIECVARRKVCRAETRPNTHHPCRPLRQLPLAAKAFLGKRALWDRRGNRNGEVDCKRVSIEGRPRPLIRPIGPIGFCRGFCRGFCSSIFAFQGGCDDGLRCQQAHRRRFPLAQTSRHCDYCADYQCWHCRRRHC